MSRHKIVDGIKVDFTDDENAERDAEEKAWVDGASARAWADLRQQRDQKLANTDWRASSDLTLSDEWKAHRKLLRDFPSTLNDITVLNEITWPEEPS